MANISNGFNHKIDLITEREVVFDFVSRLSIGKDWTDPIYSNTIFAADTNFKNVLRQIAMAFPTTVYNNLDRLECYYVEIPIGTSTVTISVPYGHTALLAISEQTGMNILPCFVASSVSSGNQNYTMTLDVPYTYTDIVRFYLTGSTIS